MAQRKVKRYRPSWERQKMVWDPFGMWVRYVAPDTDAQIVESMEKFLLYVREIIECKQCSDSDKIVGIKLQLSELRKAKERAKDIT